MAYKCGACRREFKTRRAFWVCAECAAVTCKKCIGRGCNHRGVPKVFDHLLRALPELKAAGYDMSKWEPKNGKTKQNENP